VAASRSTRNPSTPQTADAPPVEQSARTSAKQTGTAFVLPPLNLGTLQCVIVSDTPLITHAWSEKAKKLMLAKQTKEAQMAKEAKDPDSDYQQSLYIIEGGGYGFPSVAIKSAMVTACTSVAGVTKVAARQAFRVVGEQALVKGAHPGLLMRQDLVRILGSEPQMREDMVRIGQGTADLRYRAQFLHWCMEIRLSYNKALLSDGQLVNLLNVSGFGVGIGEWRSEKDGQFGAFHVADMAEVQFLKKQGVIQNTVAEDQVEHSNHQGVA
jgi:hypothetical protein